MDTKPLIKNYFETHGFIDATVKSFNQFVEWKLQKLIDETSDVSPAVIPPDTEEIKFQFGKIRVERPYIIEADGAERRVVPAEARLRDLTYAAPVFLEISVIVDGKERERTEVQIAELPVMVRSKLCYLNGLSKDERIQNGEDPFDIGGYFIINGTERSLILLEDLAPNTIFTNIEKVGPSTHIAKIFADNGTYRIPHSLERNKEGLLQLNFTSAKKIPLVIVMKALGVTRDDEIVKCFDIKGQDDEIYMNLYDYVEIKTAEEAQEALARALKLPQPREQKIQRVQHMIDNFLLPNVGSSPDERKEKAYFLGRMAKKLLLLKMGVIKPDNKDHYKNKRVRLAGDLLEDLFRTNLKVLVSDMLYIFQRGVRRGKLLSIHSLVRTKLLTSRIKSAMATGNWTSNRQGVSQRLARENHLDALSQLQRVVSLLTASQENFEARDLHPTHWGRLCPIESPEGKNIGLRKNLALMANVTHALSKSEIATNVKTIQSMGVKSIK